LDAGTQGINAGPRRQMRQPLFLLLGVSAIVLLITCCNVANLLIARGTARQREIAIRVAIGSSRGRLVRQLLTESLLLSVLGAGLGLVLAQWSGQFLLHFVGLQGREFALDINVLAFLLAITLATAALFGLLPAFQVTAVRSAPAALSNAVRGIGGGPRRRVASALVVVQVALSLWLVIGAALLIRSLQNLRALDIGMDRNRLVLMTLQLVRPIPPERRPAIQAELQRRLSIMPHVSRVTFAGYGLFGGGALTAPVRVPGSSVDPARDGDVRQNYISPGYFDTLGMTIVQGRDFNDRDTVAASLVTVVNETFARHYFGEASAVGQTVYFPSVDDQGRYIPFERGLERAQATEIVGVVRDAKVDNLRAPARRFAYMPGAHARSSGILNIVLLRMTAETSPIPAGLRELVRAVDPNLSVRSIARLDDQIANTLGQERTIAMVLSVFGGLALLLACLGLFGVMSYGVARRTAEIGVRIALGATRALVVRMVLREALMLTLLGIGLGVVAAVATTGLLQSVLFGLAPNDPVTIAAMVVFIATVGLVAGVIPASRAARIDPHLAVRCD
jgi:predicted permease